MLQPVAEDQPLTEELVADEEEHGQLVIAKAESKKNIRRGTKTEPRNLENIHARCASVSETSWIQGSMFLTLVRRAFNL